VRVAAIIEYAGIGNNGTTAECIDDESHRPRLEQDKIEITADIGDVAHRDETIALEIELLPAGTQQNRRLFRHHERQIDKGLIEIERVAVEGPLDRFASGLLRGDDLENGRSRN
jgi:hypothetical protein